MDMNKIVEKLGLWSRSEVCYPSDREAFTAAAEAIELVAWAEEVGATLYQWGSDWRCVLLDGSNHAQYYHDGTLLGCIRAAKEAYENEN